MYEQSSGSFAEGYAIGRDSNNGYGNNGFGGDWCWWVVILLIFGWGNNGFGGFGGNNAGGVVDGYVLTSDFASIERKLDGVNNGICSLGYDQLAQMNGINMNIAQNGYESRLATQTLGSQLASCCCDLKEAIGGINYNIATQTCSLGRQIETSTRDIIEASHADTDRILAYLTNEKIASLQAQNSALQGQISQAHQTNTIISALRPAPTPAYVVANPYCCNNTCGCGSTGSCSTL